MTAVQKAKNKVREVMFALNLLPRDDDAYQWRESVASGAFTVSASLPSGEFHASVAQSGTEARYEAWVAIRGHGRVATLCGGYCQDDAPASLMMAVGVDTVAPRD